MSFDRSDAVLISEVRESVSLIESYVDGLTAETFHASMLVRDAVCMRLIVIGEAANRLTQETRDRMPDLNWRGMAGLRHLLAHDYGSASPSLLWSIVSASLPELAQALKQLPDD